MRVGDQRLDPRGGVDDGGRHRGRLPLAELQRVAPQHRAAEAERGELAAGQRAVLGPQPVDVLVHEGPHHLGGAGARRPVTDEPVVAEPDLLGAVEHEVVLAGK